MKDYIFVDYEGSEIAYTNDTTELNDLFELVRSAGWCLVEKIEHPHSIIFWLA